MKIYGVRASEWDIDYNCFCATREIAEREKKKLIASYTSDMDISDYVDIDEFELIEE